jgi:hypothetical protein
LVLRMEEMVGKVVRMMVVRAWRVCGLWRR